MKSYIGTKIIYAKPMTRGEYNDYRGWTIPEDEDPNEKGYLVQYPDGYQSWSPNHVFDEAYKQSGELSFGHALEYLKQGKKVARKGWNGKDMWLCRGEGRSIGADSFWNSNTRKFAEQNGGEAEVLPYIIMKTADGKILMGWLASQTDMLAEDWCVID